MEYSKPRLSINDQITLLKKRGLVIEDENRASRYLVDISYYRLSAYLYYFLEKPKKDHNYTKGASFNDTLDLYLFDRELRILLFDLIERVEISIRSQMINYLSESHGAWWFEDESLFTNKKWHVKNLRKVDKELERSNEIFIKHYKTTYSIPERPPSWMTIEVISFGLLSMIFRNLKMSPAKKEMSKHFLLPHPYVLESWLQSIVYVRNLCAHHSRLWNRVLTITPKVPNEPLVPFLSNADIHHQKIYLFMSCGVYMLNAIIPDNSFVQRFKELIKKYDFKHLHSMGFPDNWKEEYLWVK